jgi:hypothetical protein
MTAGTEEHDTVPDRVVVLIGPRMVVRVEC